MVYKSLNGLTPNYLSSKFIPRGDVITSYKLRNSENKLAIPLPRPNYYKNNFGYIVVQSSETAYPQLLGKQHLWLTSDDC